MFGLWFSLKVHGLQIGKSRDRVSQVLLLYVQMDSLSLYICNSKGGKGSGLGNTFLSCDQSRPTSGRVVLEEGEKNTLPSRSQKRCRQSHGDDGLDLLLEVSSWRECIVMKPTRAKMVVFALRKSRVRFQRYPNPASAVSDTTVCLFLSINNK